MTDSETARFENIVYAPPTGSSWSEDELEAEAVLLFARHKFEGITGMEEK